MTRSALKFILGLAIFGFCAASAQAMVGPMPLRAPLTDSSAIIRLPHLHLARVNLCQLACERAHDRCVSSAGSASGRERARRLARCWGLYIGCLPNCIDRRLDRDVYRR